MELVEFGEDLLAAEYLRLDLGELEEFLAFVAVYLFMEFIDPGDRHGVICPGSSWTPEIVTVYWPVDLEGFLAFVVVYLLMELVELMEPGGHCRGTTAQGRAGKLERGVCMSCP